MIFDGIPKVALGIYKYLSFLAPVVIDSAES